MKIPSKSLQKKKIRSNDYFPPSYRCKLSFIERYGIPHTDEDKRVDSERRGERRGGGVGLVIPAFGGIALNSHERGAKPSGPIEMRRNASAG